MRDGGTGHIWGPVLGAVVVTFVDRQLTDLGSYSAIIIGLGTVLVLIFLPRGIAGVFDDAVTAVFRNRRTPAAGAESLATTEPAAP